MVPADSTGISRVPAYSGAACRWLGSSRKGLSPASAPAFQPVPLTPPPPVGGPTTSARASPRRRFGLHPRSLAATGGIVLTFSSCGYLDVSVPHVRLRNIAGCRDRSRRVAPFGHPRVKGYLLLAVAFRSLSRPSSPPRAKASPMRPCFIPLYGQAARPLVCFRLSLLFHPQPMGTALVVFF